MLAVDLPRIAVAQAPSPATTAPVAAEPLVTRRGPKAVVVWDITPAVKAYLSSTEAENDEIRDLEVQAAGVLLRQATALADAQDITLHVVYGRSPDLSPSFASELRTTVERLFTLEATRDAIVHSSNAWPAALKAGTIPKNLSVDVTGKLPARQ